MTDLEKFLRERQDKLRTPRDWRTSISIWWTNFNLGDTIERCLPFLVFVFVFIAVAMMLWLILLYMALK